MKADIPWELRYRTARGIVDNIRIDTFTLEEAEAVDLGNRVLDAMQSPSVRFVGVRPMVAGRSSEHPELVAKWGNGKTAPATAEDDEPPAVKEARPGRPALGSRVGA